MTPVKTIVAGALVAATMTLSIPTPASAIGIFVGPRGGVGVRVGGFGYRGGYGYGYRRGFAYRRPFVRRGYIGPRVYRRY